MDECLLCTMETAGEDVIMFRDDLWAAEVVPGYDVPGWIILRARRHAERITGLNEAELATFAQRSRDVVAAVTDVTGAPVTYLMIFGENYPHSMPSSPPAVPTSRPNCGPATSCSCATTTPTRPPRPR